MMEYISYINSKIHFWGVIFPSQFYVSIVFWFFILVMSFSQEKRNLFLKKLSLNPYAGSGEFYYYLDVLKGFAALIVVGLHLWSFNMPFYQAAPIYFSPFGQGQKGVAIFLVVSGFVISKYFSGINVINGEIVRNFFIRRFIRLYPLYIAVTIFFYFNIISAPNAQTHKFFAELFLWSEFNFLQNGVAWSMIVEMKMYLIAPLFFMIFGPSRHWRIVFSSLIILFLILSEPTGSNEVNSPISPWYKYFFFGILGNELVFYTRNIKGFVNYLFFGTGLLIAFFDFTGYFLFFEKFSMGTKPMEFRTFLSNQLGVSIMILCIFGGSVKNLGILTNNFLLVWVGIISYSLYLTQFIFIGQSLYNPGIQEDYALTFYLVLLPFHIITATFIFLLFEKFPRYLFQKYSRNHSSPIIKNE